MTDVDLASASWRKGRASGSGDNCVEVASRDGRYGIRDSKDIGPIIVLTRREWVAFVDVLKARSDEGREGHR